MIQQQGPQSKRIRSAMTTNTSPSYLITNESNDMDGSMTPASSVLSGASSSVRSPRKRGLYIPLAHNDWSPKDRHARRFMPFLLVVVGLFWTVCMAVLLVEFHFGGKHRRYHSTPPGSLMAPLQALRPHVIPLPLPKEKVSVILMNYSRPRMIRESSLMRTLLSHENIDEVLLLHANPKTAFEFVHPKVVNIDATEQNDEIGLSLRFYFCQIAKNDWVIHVDDDMEFTTNALNELLREYGRNTKRIVGRFGRDLSLGNSFNGYNSRNTHKSTEVVLTKLMVMERDTCSSFFEHAHLLWDDVVLKNGEGPLWNGEDVFMSLVANHVYGKKGHGFNNYAMDWLDVWQAPDALKDYEGGQMDVSGGMSDFPRIWDWQWWQAVLRRNRHYSYRGKLWQTAKARLEETSS